MDDLVAIDSALYNGNYGDSINITDYGLTHYRLVAGLKNTTDYREFYICAPWYDHRDFWVTEQKLKNMMHIPPELSPNVQPNLVWTGSYL
jgi:hypothetical protein